MYTTTRHCEERSDVAIFDLLIADFSIEDCHATLAMTREKGGETIGHQTKKHRHTAVLSNIDL